MLVAMFVVILALALGGGTYVAAREISSKNTQIAALDSDLHLALESLTRIKDDVSDSPSKDAETTLSLLSTTTRQINQ